MLSEVREGVGHAVIQSASAPSLALALTYFLFFIPDTTPFFFLFLHILTLLSFIYLTRLLPIGLY
jgi:hypothetical protein